MTHFAGVIIRKKENITGKYVWKTLGRSNVEESAIPFVQVNALELTSSSRRMGIEYPPNLAEHLLKSRSQQPKKS